MIPPGMSAYEWAHYKTAYFQSTKWAVQLRVTTLNYTHLADLSPYGIDGQWNINATADVARTLQLGLLDAGGRATVYLNPDVAPRRLIHVRQGTWSAALNRWLWVPTIVARPTVVEDSGDQITIEAQDKSCLHLRNVPAGTIPKGRYIVDAIRDGLRAAGEIHIRIPGHSAVKAKTTRDTPIGGDDENRQPWKVWRRLAASIGFQLFYSGDGYATMRRIPTTSQVTMKFDERVVLSRPTASTDMTNLRNRWIGAGKAGLRGDVSAVGIYSPTSLAVGGVPWGNIEFADANDALVTKAQMIAQAKAQLTSLITMSTDVACSVVPFHAVDPLDVNQIATPDGFYTFVTNEASVPIMGDVGGGGSEGWPMTFGYQRRVRRSSAGRVHLRRVKAKKK